MEKVSVIVPIYNGEKNIDKCLETIVNQSYKNLEIILLDDGSMDSSLQKCREWEEKDQRIKVIHKKNTGVSDTRNYGLDVSTGKYITFVDIDDYLEYKMIEKLYDSIIANKSDISISGFYIVNENDNIVGSRKPIKSKSVDYYMFFNDLLKEKQFIASLWGKLFSRELLKYKRLNVNYRICEDLDYIYNICDNCTKVSYINDCLYYYKINEQSVTRTASIDKYYDELDVLTNIINTCDFRLKKYSICRYVRINIELLWKNKNSKYLNDLKRNIKKYSFKYILFSNYFSIKNKIKYIILTLF